MNKFEHNIHAVNELRCRRAAALFWVWTPCFLFLCGLAELMATRPEEPKDAISLFCLIGEVGLCVFGIACPLAVSGQLIDLSRSIGVAEQANLVELEYCDPAHRLGSLVFAESDLNPYFAYRNVLRGEIAGRETWAMDFAVQQGKNRMCYDYSSVITFPVVCYEIPSFTLIPRRLQNRFRHDFGISLDKHPDIARRFWLECYEFEAVSRLLTPEVCELCLALHKWEIRVTGGVLTLMRVDGRIAPVEMSDRIESAARLAEALERACIERS